MIKKVLIANRGEIAVRIARACTELGIQSVAIYTDADRYSLHLRKADEAYNLGPDSVSGYLNVHRIVNLATATGCDALHPGYGFLSENPLLAEACEKRGIRFIGPSAAIIRHWWLSTSPGNRFFRQRRQCGIGAGSSGRCRKNRLPGDVESHQWRRRPGNSSLY